jgi:hypothetical protein
MEASYSQVDDLSSENLNKPPLELIDQCKNGGAVNLTNEIVSGDNRSIRDYFDILRPIAMRFGHDLYPSRWTQFANERKSECWWSSYPRKS